MPFLPAAVTPLRRVLSWGDSIVAGAAFNGENTKYSFATEAVRQSNGRLSATANFNQGIGGERSDQILARASNWNAPLLSPQLFGVLCDGGINDFAQSVSQETAAGNVLQMFAAIRAAGARVCWLDVLPTSSLASDSRRTYLNTAAHNALLAGECYIDTSDFNPTTEAYDGTTHPGFAAMTRFGTRAVAAMDAAGWFKP